MRICGVYAITCKANGKRYIGSSESILRRWREHVYNLESKLMNGMYEDYQKYGITGFTFKVLEVCDEDIRRERERYYIDLYKAKDRRFGYTKSY